MQSFFVTDYQVNSHISIYFVEKKGGVFFFYFSFRSSQTKLIHICKMSPSCVGRQERMRVFWLPRVAAACVLLILAPFAGGQDPDQVYRFHKCSDEDYKSNGTYQNNLRQMLRLLDGKNDMNYGFYNLSVGEGSDTVNAITLCRGDVSKSDCDICRRASTKAIPYLCSSQKEAILMYDNCMLRYSNRSIFHTVEINEWNFYEATEANWFKKAVDDLLSRLQREASLGDSLIKFATGDAYIIGVNRTKIYGLV